MENSAAFICERRILTAAGRFTRGQMTNLSRGGPVMVPVIAFPQSERTDFESWIANPADVWVRESGEILRTAARDQVVLPARLGVQAWAPIAVCASSAWQDQ